MDQTALNVLLPFAGSPHIARMFHKNIEIEKLKPPDDTHYKENQIEKET